MAEKASGVPSPSRVSRGLIGIIRTYKRFVSPLMPARCRFVPSCSTYAVQALEEHGPIRGSWLTLWRLLRCQPFARSGFDPVPPKKSGA
jgi:putative membrane protein insertion efficiency factor